MDIVVGAVKAVSLPESSSSGNGGAVEGVLLAVRSPRGARPSTDKSRITGEERRRRRSERRADPPGSRVLTLLVLDPAGIPSDTDTASYRVVLRFIRTS